MKSLIPLLVLASAVAGAVDIQKRILNGEDCGPDQGQHYVVLTRGRFDDRFCGGNLISDQWVLTAGHCDKGDFYVILGKHPHGHETTMQITTGDVRHVYNADGHNHDIMLLKLPQKPTKDFSTIQLPKLGCHSTTGESEGPYTIMGWSYTAYDAATETYHNLPAKLQCGTVHLHPDCTGRNLDVPTVTESSHRYIREHMLCSIEPEGPRVCDSCPGDSGGSLVRHSLLYGVTVTGGAPGTGLTDYMDVCAYRDWIHKVTGI